MCGIVGYIGEKQAADILLEGLKRLEYRGYDSAGLSVFDSDRINTVRAEGKLANLSEAIKKAPLTGNTGIGHTRWATHGAPSEQNAHPHKAGPVVVVHNGIIENHLVLRKDLKAQGCEFKSDTDTEIVSHLIAIELDKGLVIEDAVRNALIRVEGSYAIAVLSETEPEKIIAARNFSPLVLGIGENENFIASDIPAIIMHTRDIVFLNDGEIAVLKKDGVCISNMDGQQVDFETKHINWSPTMAEKGGYKHFMLKEINEQPRAISDTLRGRISLERGQVTFGDDEFADELLDGINRIIIIACGTSWHAALVGKFWIERHAQIPVEVDQASEFRYRSPVISKDVLVIAISQSGETADTLAAIHNAKESGAKVLSICNVVESSIPRASHATIYTHAGPEISVASTKAFVTQLSVLYLVAIHIAVKKNRMDDRRAAHKLLELIRVPLLLKDILKKTDELKAIAQRFHRVADFLFIGRWINYPIALEGALKLKEISYIHAEGYPAGEMKHGPIALVDENMVVVTLVTKDRIYEKILSNMQEAQARQGTIIAISSEGDEEINNFTDHIFRIPLIEEELEPLLTVIPMQLLAYFIADYNGTDVDQPRNLAKSVTVE